MSNCMITSFGTIVMAVLPPRFINERVKIFIVHLIIVFLACGSKLSDETLMIPFSDVFKIVKKLLLWLT